MQVCAWIYSQGKSSRVPPERLKYRDSSTDFNLYRFDEYNVVDSSKIIDVHQRVMAYQLSLNIDLSWFADKNGKESQPETPIEFSAKNN